MAVDKLKAVCSLAELQVVAFREQAITLKGQATSAVVFLFAGKVYSYVNHCMHMQRRLNAEQPAIFDDTGKYLRCSMHGFIFEPSTGECLSPVCYGQHLQAIRVVEIDGMVYFSEKHLVLT